MGASEGYITVNTWYICKVKLNSKFNLCFQV